MNEMKRRENKKRCKSLILQRFISFCIATGRRVRDSNPRTCYSQRFSRPPRSTALPTLRRKNRLVPLIGKNLFDNIFAIAFRQSIHKFIFRAQQGGAPRRRRNRMSITNYPINFRYANFISIFVLTKYAIPGHQKYLLQREHPAVTCLLLILKIDLL